MLHPLSSELGLVETVVNAINYWRVQTAEHRMQKANGRRL